MSNKKDILQNAKIATAVWNGLDKDQREELHKYFHLRPTNSGITIITTLPFSPMRGLVEKNDVNLRKKLDDIYKELPILYSTEEGKAKECLNVLGFKLREQDTDSLEEAVQALMIRNMSTDSSLQKRLGAKEKIRFIASEFIFEQGNNRVDIIGYDGTDLYLFELKKDRTTKVEQVRKYVDYYNKNRALLVDILRDYPINPVKSPVNDLRGVMVMQFAERSAGKTCWDDLKKEHGVDIVFYEKYLAFK